MNASTPFNNQEAPIPLSLRYNMDDQATSTYHSTSSVANYPSYPSVNCNQNIPMGMLNANAGYQSIHYPFLLPVARYTPTYTPGGTYRSYNQYRPPTSRLYIHANPVTRHIASGPSCRQNATYTHPTHNTSLANAPAAHTTTTDNILGTSYIVYIHIGTLKHIHTLLRISTMYLIVNQRNVYADNGKKCRNTGRSLKNQIVPVMHKLLQFESAFSQRACRLLYPELDDIFSDMHNTYDNLRWNKHPWTKWQQAFKNGNTDRGISVQFLSWPRIYHRFSVAGSFERYFVNVFHKSMYSFHLL